MATCIGPFFSSKYKLLSKGNNNALNVNKKKVIKSTKKFSFNTILLNFF